MNINLNKNISVWRGNNTPPTDYHLWIKDDGSILVKVQNQAGQDEWVSKTGPYLDSSIKITTVTSLEEALQWLSTQSTIILQPGTIIKFQENDKWVEYISIGNNYQSTDNWEIIGQQNVTVELQEQIDALQIVQIEPTDNEILTSYQLQDKNNTVHGVTINIPKDKSIKDVQVLDTNATIDGEGNLQAGDPVGTTALCIVYITQDGSYKLVKLDYSKFIEETEYGNGLTVQDHIISIKLNTNSQTSKYIDLDQNGLGIKGIDEEIEEHTTNITSDQISDGAITTNKIASGAITNEKLATNSVTTDKINNNAITTSKLANNSVSTDKIIDGAITANKLADSVIKLNELPGEDETSIKTYELRINNIDQTLIGKIDIPKDQHLVDVKVSDTNATLNDSGLIVDGNPKGTTALVLSYYLEDGTYKIAKLDYQRFIEEAEIGDGLDIVDGKVIIKLDSSAQTSKYLQVTDSGIGVKGIDEAIETAKTSVDFIKTTMLTSEDDIELIESSNKLKVNTWNDPNTPNNVPKVEYGTPPQVSNPNGSILSIGDGNGNNTLIFLGKSSYTPFENRVAVKRQGETGGWDNLLQSKTLSSTYNDFNEIKDSGIYFLNSSFPSILNAPENITLDYGYLIVTSDNYDHFIQTFIGADGTIATRYNNGQSSNYNNWNIIRPSYQIIPSGSDLSTYNKSGVYLFGEDSLNSYTGLGTLSSSIFDSSKSIRPGSKLVITNNNNGIVTQAFYIYDNNSNELTIFHRGDTHNGGSLTSSPYFLDYSSSTLNNSLKVNSTGLIKNNDTALTNDEKDITFKQLSRGLELLYKGLYIDQSSNQYSNYILFGKVSETFNINGQIILQRDSYQYNISACIYFAVSVTHNLPDSDVRREASFHILTNGHSPDGLDINSNILKFKILQVTVDGEEYLAGWIPNTMGGYISIYGIQHNVSKTSNVTLVNTRDNTITDGDIICDKDVVYEIIGNGQLPNDFKDLAVFKGDLNDYHGDTYLGYYIAQGGSTPSNAPDGVSHFGLQVLRASGTNYAQILYAESKIYYRNYTNSTWTSWVDLTKDTTYNNATTTAAGLMSADDKVAVDSIAYKRYTLNLTDLDSSTFYPVVLTPNQAVLSIDCEINSQSAIGSDPYNLNRVKFSLTSKGAYDEKNTFTLWNAYNFDDNEITIGSIGHTTSGRGGTGVVFLRGSKNYSIITNATPTLHTESYTNTDVNNSPWTVAPGSAITGGTNSAIEFYWKNDSTRNTSEYINAKYSDIPLGFKTLYSACLNSSAEENDECWLLLGKLTDSFEINGILFIQRSIGGYPQQASIFLTAGRSYSTDSGGVIGSYHIINTSQWDDNNYLDCKIEVITYNEEDYLAFHIPHSLSGYNLRLYGVETHTTWSGISLIRLGTSPTIVRVVSDRDNVFNTLGVDKSDLTYLVGNNTVTTLESTPVTKKLVVANLTESQILSLASNLPAGHELHIILNNNSDASITVTLPYNT